MILDATLTWILILVTGVIIISPLIKTKFMYICVKKLSTSVLTRTIYLKKIIDIFVVLIFTNFFSKISVIEIYEAFKMRLLLTFEAVITFESVIFLING